MELVMLCNVEARANESRWGLMSGGEAGSGAQALTAPPQNLTFISQGLEQLCASKNAFEGPLCWKGKEIVKGNHVNKSTVLSLWN